MIFYRFTVHFGIYRVHSPTNALFIKFENALKFTLKFTLSLLLHVSVYDHHQGSLRWSLAKVIFMLKLSTKLHRYLLCGTPAQYHT
jgi:cytochrome c oxidase subunit IV